MYQHKEPEKCKKEIFDTICEKSHRSESNMYDK